MKTALTPARVPLSLSCLVMAIASPALAGPPYTTDDPEPTPTGHWEDRVFANGLRTPGVTTGQTGLDLNYGAAKDLQLTLLAPLDYSAGRQSAIGTGNIQLSAKYRFVRQSRLLPDIALFPAVSLPTQAASFGPARLSLFLPVWAQKDIGPWSLFGGAGYDINPGPGNQNYTLTGLGLTRQFGKRLNMGAEIYHQTSATVGGKALTATAFGVIYQLNEHWALMASGGPAVQPEASAGQGVFYMALQLTY